MSIKAQRSKPSSLTRFARGLSGCRSRMPLIASLLSAGPRRAHPHQESAVQPSRSELHSERDPARRRRCTDPRSHCMSSRSLWGLIPPALRAARASRAARNGCGARSVSSFRRSRNEWTLARKRRIEVAVIAKPARKKQTPRQLDARSASRCCRGPARSVEYPGHAPFITRGPRCMRGPARPLGRAPQCQLSRTPRSPRAASPAHLAWPRSLRRA